MVEAIVSYFRPLTALFQWLRKAKVLRRERRWEEMQAYADLLARRRSEPSIFEEPRGGPYVRLAALVRSGDLLIESGQLAQAEEYFARVAETDGDLWTHYLAHSRLVQIHLARHNTMNAAADLRRLIDVYAASRASRAATMQHIPESFVRLGFQDSCIQVTQGLLKIGNSRLALELLERSVSASDDVAEHWAHAPRNRSVTPD